MSEDTKEHLIGWIGAVAKVIAALTLIVATASTILLSALSLGEDRLRDFTSTFVGAAQNTEKLEQLTDDVTRMVSAVNDIKILMRTVHPPKVATFDSVRSKVYSEQGEEGVCYAGQVCEVRFLGARTEYGANCKFPSLRRILTVDEDNTPSAALPVDMESVKQVLSVLIYEWRSIYFIPGRRAAPGYTEVFMELDHPCPDGMILTETPKIPFILKEAPE